MRPTKSQVDEVVYHLSELSKMIGVKSGELLTFIKVLSKASWASVEFEPMEDVKFEFEGVLGGDMRLEVTVREGHTTIIKEFVIPRFFLKDDDLYPVEAGPSIPLKAVRKVRRKTRGRKGRRR